jgi:osmotically inducible protein OsmC
MAVSKAQATWTGTLKEGSGTVKSGNGFFEAPFTYVSRFEGDSGGTNPEELIGAAQAGCFSMFLAAQLTNAGHAPKTIETQATVHLSEGSIRKIELETLADVPGVARELFDEKVDFSKKNCPISKALAAIPELVVNAKLRS